MTDDVLPDPAFASLLADPRATLRPPPPDMTMTAYRQRLDRPMAAVAGPAVAVEEAETAGGVRLRLYHPTPHAAATILFMHGGGFVIGSLDTHDALCRRLAVASGATVVSVGYRLAPEHAGSAAEDDCLAALRWTVEARGGLPLSLCGDSAGGYLAAVTALRAATESIAVAALGLFYPVVGPACATPSWNRLGTGYMLTREWMRWAWRARLGDSPPGRDDDLLQADLRQVPRTHVITAAFDPLRDEGEALVAAVVAQGGSATLSRYSGMIHGFASLPMLTPLADQAIAEMADRLMSQQQR